MLELFKGQLDLDKIKYEMPYKEALMLREARIERLKKEKEDIERERQEEKKRQDAVEARNKIHLASR